MRVSSTAFEMCFDLSLTLAATAFTTGAGLDADAL